MRCLYCGKELALLKRWTGGGEFCSDAHRQRYQEEYNQLALNRLLQAKPTGDPKSKPEPKPAPAEAARELIPVSAPVSAVPTAAPRLESAPAAVFVHTPEPVAPIAEPNPVEVPAAAVAPEVTAPAGMAGFFVERPVVVLSELAEMLHPDMEFLDAGATALPSHIFEPLDARRDTYQLETAGLLTFQPSNRASNYIANGSRERRLEVRDFVRMNPVVEIDLSPVGETGLETSSEAMDILIFPKPPQGLPVLWQEPPLRFAADGTELGSLARLSFAATGFSGEEESAEVEFHGAVALAEPLASDIFQEEPAVEILVAPEPSAPFEAAGESIPDPVVEAAAVAEPEAESVLERRAEPVEEVVEQVVEQSPPVPELVTKPLPLVLHVAAPSKGKPAQVFSSASNAVDVQVPRSTSLPLRPVIVFGAEPAKEVEKPVEKKSPERPAQVSVKGEPKKSLATNAAVRPDKKAEPAKEAVPALKQVAKGETPSTKPAKDVKRQDVKEVVKLKEDAKPGTERVLPASLAAPHPGSSDLGLPRLDLQPSPGFLGQLPAVAKIGIAVVLLAVVGGLIAISSKSDRAAAAGANAGAVMAGSPLPVGEAGWITDWGSDPGVRRTRQISILRSSQTLTDYRIEMQGQIETKAIGWVFRAADPKNFYVTKLEIVKPGLEPTVALIRFAIINGEEQAHAQIPLPMKVRRDTMYKIRFDAVGNHFTTYIQDEKVDDWRNDNIKTGGVGLYSERGEVATLKGGMNVVPLIVRK